MVMSHIIQTIFHHGFSLTKENQRTAEIEKDCENIIPKCSKNTIHNNFHQILALGFFLVAIHRTNLIHP